MVRKVYRFVPQKRRSRFRIWLGTAYYCLVRSLLWIRFRKHFVRLAKNAPSAEEIRSLFPFVAAEHSVPLFRNLSEADTALQKGKAHNVALALKRMSGIVLERGKVFSYWRLLGNPTARRGFQKGMMLVNGKPVAAVGGGLCALSNLIYWLALHTPLTVIERYRHSYDVFPDSNRKEPFGSGATCVYNYRDLMIQNETDAQYALLLWIEDDRLFGEWRTKNPVRDRYEVYQKEHWITAEIGGVYVRHNTIWRRHFVLDADGSEKLAGDEYVTENHALMMYEPLLEQKTERTGAAYEAK